MRGDALEDAENQHHLEVLLLNILQVHACLLAFFQALILCWPRMILKIHGLNTSLPIPVHPKVGH
jgi:hypothetical protein